MMSANSALLRRRTPIVTTVPSAVAASPMGPHTHDGPLGSEGGREVVTPGGRQRQDGKPVGRIGGGGGGGGGQCGQQVGRRGAGGGGGGGGGGCFGSVILITSSGSRDSSIRAPLFLARPSLVSLSATYSPTGAGPEKRTRDCRSLPSNAFTC